MSPMPPPDMRSWIAAKVRAGDFVSEEALIEAALRSLRDNEAHGADSLLDAAFMADCEREGDDAVTVEEVRAATASIRDSMSRVIVEEERAERF